MLALLKTMLPLTIWFACFSLLYGIATLACGSGLLMSGGRHESLALVVVSLIALAVIGVRAVKTHQFLTIVSRGLSVLAILAMFWLIAPLFMIKAC